MGKQRIPLWVCDSNKGAVEAIKNRAVQVVLLIGPPGVGKTRLIQEFAHPNDLILDPGVPTQNPETLDAVVADGRRVWITALTNNEFHSWPPKLRTRMVSGVVLQLNHWTTDERRRFFATLCPKASDDLAAEIAKFMTTAAELIGAATTLNVAIPLGLEETVNATNALIPNALVVKGATSAERVLAATSEYFRVPVAELVGPARTKQRTYARHVAIYLIGNMTALTLGEIGDHFGGRDHTSILHAKTKIAGLMLSSGETRADVDALRRRLALGPRHDVIAKVYTRPQQCTGRRPIELVRGKAKG